MFLKVKRFVVGFLGGILFTVLFIVYAREANAASIPLILAGGLVAGVITMSGILSQ